MNCYEFLPSPLLNCIFNFLRIRRHHRYRQTDHQLFNTLILVCKSWRKSIHEQTFHFYLKFVHSFCERKLALPRIKSLQLSFLVPRRELHHPPSNPDMIPLAKCCWRRVVDMTSLQHLFLDSFASQDLSPLIQLLHLRITIVKVSEPLIFPPNITALSVIMSNNLSRQELLECELNLPAKVRNFKLFCHNCDLLPNISSHRSLRRFVCYTHQLTQPFPASLRSLVLHGFGNQIKIWPNLDNLVNLHTLDLGWEDMLPIKILNILVLSIGCPPRVRVLRIRRLPRDIKVIRGLLKWRNLEIIYSNVTSTDVVRVGHCQRLFVLPQLRTILPYTHDSEFVSFLRP
jgi:hypothetical protein